MNPTPRRRNSKEPARGKAQEQTEGGLEDKEELERLRRENKELEAMYKEEKLRRDHCSSHLLCTDPNERATPLYVNQVQERTAIPLVSSRTPGPMGTHNKQPMTGTARTATETK
ncbi:UNVERIFIED_CONTAM: hypothetical protein FKN15_022700 [Acipenser sinensis]